MILAKKMAGKLSDALNCDGFNIVQNNGEIAGQTVFHFHMSDFSFFLFSRY